MAQDFEAPFGRICSLAAHLPEVKEGTSYGSPALKVNGTTFARLKDAGTLVLMTPMEAKEVLFQTAPDIYFETDHYVGWPALLVRLDAIADEELKLRLENAWAEKAPKRLLASRQARTDP